MRADDGRELWTEVSGTGPAVVLVHGGPGLWDMFGALAADLADRFTVWRWDQRGCGRSAPGGPYTVERFVADLDAVVTAAGAPVAVLGHSWGAQLALRYALAHPDRVTRLVYLAGTGLSPTAWKPAFHAAFVRRIGPDAARLLALRERYDRAAAVLQWTADVADPARAEEIAEAMATPWFAVNMDVNAGIAADVAAHWDEAALEEACRQLTVPTLILDGAADIRPRWALDTLAAALPGVTRVTLPGVGHVPWLEAPDAALPPLRAFLEAGRERLGVQDVQALGRAGDRDVEVVDPAG
ncbi:MAG TPA: alpha/beta hydrolase [Mycobacteriales bacterium]|nr:alpha/beta hydrolase [Mycobacteriales bacterium]